MHFSFLSNCASPVDIALVHSLFNIGACIVLYPFADKIVALSTLIIGEDKTDDESEKNDNSDITLDARFLDNPAFAMQLARNLTKTMAEETLEALRLAIDCLKKYDKKTIKKVYALEERSDRYEDVLGTYLVKLSSKNLSKSDSQSMSVILHSISDYERIVDHATNLAESATEMKKKELEFSKSAKEELGVLASAVIDIMSDTVRVFSAGNMEEAKGVEPLEEVIDSLTKEIKKNHIRRLRKGKCTIELGLILEDILTNLERISDHCSNIAVEMITTSDDSYDTHEFFEKMSESDKKSFDKRYNILKSKYTLSND